VPDEVIDRYAARLPAPLIGHWRDAGWCGYAGGLIWVVNPLGFEDVLVEWGDLFAGDALVFARTAFGNLFVWQDGKVHFASIHYGWKKSLTDNVEIFFEVLLCDDRYVAEGLDGRLYWKALPRLGRPAADECYAFVPALVMGGPGTAETLHRVKLREHLGFLAQVI
jgi:hypothetical protein